METVLSIVFGAVGVAIVVTAVGIAYHKWKHNTMANLEPRKEKF